jgi:hypothetical protein
MEEIYMSPEEAIKRIEDHIRVHHIGEYPHIYLKEALDMALEALEKQIPEKPDLEGDGYWDGELVYDTSYCPRCNQDYEIEYHTPKFCENCGQALNWE